MAYVSTTSGGGILPQSTVSSTQPHQPTATLPSVFVSTSYLLYDFTWLSLQKAALRVAFSPSIRLSVCSSRLISITAFQSTLATLYIQKLYFLFMYFNV